MVDYPKYPRTSVLTGLTRVKKPTAENVSPAPSSGVPSLRDLGITVNGGPAETEAPDPGTPIRVTRVRRRCGACGK